MIAAEYVLETGSIVTPLGGTNWYVKLYTTAATTLTESFLLEPAGDDTSSEHGTEDEGQATKSLNSHQPLSLHTVSASTSAIPSTKDTSIQSRLKVSTKIFPETFYVKHNATTPVRIQLARRIKHSTETLRMFPMIKPKEEKVRQARPLCHRISFH